MVTVGAKLEPWLAVLVGEEHPKAGATNKTAAINNVKRMKSSD
jgi:hypothetical protein